MWVQDVRKGWIMAAGLVSLIAGGAAVAAGTGSQGGNGQTGQGATGTNDSEFNQPDARDRTGSDDRRGAGEEGGPTLNGDGDQERRNQTEERDNGSEVVPSPQHTHDGSD